MPPNINMWEPNLIRVFISHASEQAELARNIKHELVFDQPFLTRLTTFPFGCSLHQLNAARVFIWQVYKCQNFHGHQS